MRALRLTVLSIAAVCSAPRLASAVSDCVGKAGSQDWAAISTSAGAAATGPANDTSFNAWSGSHSYIAQGSQLFGICNVVDGSGQCASAGQKMASWPWNAPGGNTINSFASPVPLSGSRGEFIFLG